MLMKPSARMINGGGFCETLLELWQRADSKNKALIELTWPDHFEPDLVTEYTERLHELIADAESESISINVIASLSGRHACYVTSLREEGL